VLSCNTPKRIQFFFVLAPSIIIAIAIANKNIKRTTNREIRILFYSQKSLVFAKQLWISSDWEKSCAPRRSSQSWSIFSFAPRRTSAIPRTSKQMNQRAQTVLLSGKELHRKPTNIWKKLHSFRDICSVRKRDARVILQQTRRPYQGYIDLCDRNNCGIASCGTNGIGLEA